MSDTEQRFGLTMATADRDEPGLIRERDGTVWLVNPDGTRTQLPGGGGSGIPQGGPLTEDLVADGNQLLGVASIIGNNDGVLQMSLAGVVRLLNSLGHDMIASNNDYTLLGVAGAVSINPAGYFTLPGGSAPADVDIADSELTLWFDSTPGAPTLKIKAKDANGDVYTATIPLTAAP